MSNFIAKIVQISSVKTKDSGAVEKVRALPSYVGLSVRITPLCPKSINNLLDLNQFSLLLGLLYGFRITSQASRHKARKHKLRRCRFRAIIFAMFNYRCGLAVGQGKKEENVPENAILAHWGLLVNGAKYRTNFGIW